MSERESEDTRREPDASATPAKAPAPVQSDSGDVIFETLWGRVLEAWDDEKAHAALLDYALRAEKLPETAGRYRAWKDDPEKGARATKKLGAIVLAAESMLMAMKTPRAQKVSWQVTLSAFVVSAFLLMWLAYAVSRK